MQVCVTRTHEQQRLIIYNLKEMYTFFHPEMFQACTLNTVLWLEQRTWHMHMYSTSDCLMGLGRLAFLAV